MPDSWIEVKLEDVVEVRDFERDPINSTERNQRLVGKSQSDLYPYYGATGQVGWIDAYRSAGQQVLLGEDGAPFLDPNRDKAYLVDGRYWVNNHAHVLRGLDGLMENRLLAHQLNIADYQQFVSGSTRLKLTSAAMKRMPLLLPPFNEQTRIIEKLEELLSDLDAGVAELKAAQRKLAQYRQSLLKAAVEGTLTADWRAARAQTGGPQETGAELLQRILTERRARWEASQLTLFAEQGKAPPKNWQAKYKEPVAPKTANLPVLPSGWVWGSLDQVVAESLLGIDRGKEHQSLVDGNASYIKMNNISMEGSVDTSALVRVDASPEEIDRYSLASGDLLFNTRNSRELVGKTGMIQEVDPTTVYNNNLMRLRFDGSITPAFACHQMCSVVFRGRMEKVKKATTSVAAVYAKDLFPLQVVVPPMEEQIAIDEMLVEFLRAVDQQEATVQSGLRQSAAQRKNILKAAFAGQLVPQDPNDEPANALLERIRAERATSDTASKRGRKPRTTA
ncbi:hypothetical protein B0E47_12810 [Rhodanobacter sp. B05]|nr:hypothetical protein B0E47_12810 [Rhodanobacter sp. B05]